MRFNFVMLLLIVSFLTFFDMSSKNIEQIENDILNVLSYGKGYFGGHHPAGYHSVKLGENLIQGQRNPWMRLQSVPYDFSNKVVLDLGSNMGGMLFAISDKIKFGVGVDFESRAINVANRLKMHYKLNNVNFFSYNLEKDSLELIKAFFEDEIDICFMLSMAACISNWQDVVMFASSVANTLLYEAHGPELSQKSQIDWIKNFYKNILLIRPTSDDDPQNKNRSLYLCFN
jgi:hypothetical protein